MTYDLQAGVVGAVITVTLTEDGAALNLTTAASVEVVLRGPRGPRVTKDATIIDAANGLVRVSTAAADLDLHGKWQIQARITFDDGTIFPSEVLTFEVGPNL